MITCNRFAVAVIRYNFLTSLVWKQTASIAALAKWHLFVYCVRPTMTLNYDRRMTTVSLSNRKNLSMNKPS